MTEAEKKEIINALEGNMMIYKELKNRMKYLFCGRLINKLKYGNQWN